MASAAAWFWGGGRGRGCPLLLGGLEVSDEGVDRCGGNAHGPADVDALQGTGAD